MPKATQVDLSQISLRIETTPNPATMKFCFSQAVIDSSVDYNSVLETESSPLVAKIFGFPWTNSVFLAPDFVAVTKQDWVEWDYLASPLSSLISEHLTQNIPVYIEVQNDEALGTGADSDLVKRIKQAIEREIRPIVAFDGGDVQFGELTSEGILHVIFKGACAGCPSKSTTLKQGIEVRLKELFPEISEVVG